MSDMSNTNESGGMNANTIALLKSMKAMPGGKRRTSSKKRSSKKGSSKKESRTLDGGKRRSSKKGSSKMNDENLDDKKHKSKKGSKGSKKGSRRMKREMPKPMQDVLNIKSKIKSDDSSIKDGIPLTTLVWKMYKENGLQIAKTVAAYMSDKSGFAKKLQAVVKEQAAKRAAKKAGKS